MPISEDLPPDTPAVVVEYFFALECPWLGWFEPAPGTEATAAA
ncbi:hypothetical protein [Crossiella cryophila]|uniref:Uncharacterized protein n=1 Tax=Crossiella cryophila TaxID=43355 RepID=A0A7W7CDR2_9PSEU|nr:hypothetical protein [Crossiella cryophila]MBB4679258.1 hypothetical protein [Crossiella cryophila]